MLHHSASVRELIDRAIQEDLSGGDPTTDALVPPDATGQALMSAKAGGVLCGGEASLEVFRRLDPRLEGHALLEDGATLHPGDLIARLAGSVNSLLKGERTALNFIQHMSGIATETARYVDAVRGLPVRIVDTRKTLPGLRALEKYAVRVGGGHNHRYNLADGVLVKDNHLAVVRARGLSLAHAVRQARERASHTLKVEIEVISLAEAREALEAGADLLLLDNMSLEEMRQVVALAGKKALLEASGGITLERVRAVAETGVHIISVGALTHSARALDITVDLLLDQPIV
ncbi:MAG: carboxylating nicotinate-nucleotide diphosphorylase [Chloroflexi bacterium]|nr:carboxylating nicotinate-nucleotide diphosphorylase [Chloroflexota bacterium]